MFGLKCLGLNRMQNELKRSSPSIVQNQGSPTNRDKNQNSNSNSFPIVLPLNETTCFCLPEDQLVPFRFVRPHHIYYRGQKTKTNFASMTGNFFVENIGNRYSRHFIPLPQYRKIHVMAPCEHPNWTFLDAISSTHYGKNHYEVQKNITDIVESSLSCLIGDTNEELALYSKTRLVTKDPLSEFQQGRILNDLINSSVFLIIIYVANSEWIDNFNITKAFSPNWNQGMIFEIIQIVSAPINKFVSLRSLHNELNTIQSSQEYGSPTPVYGDGSPDDCSLYCHEELGYFNEEDFIEEE